MWGPLATLVAVVAGGCIVVAIGGATQRADALLGPSRIRITNQETRFTRIDVGRRGLSPGDLEVSRHALYNRRIRRAPIGRSEMICTYLFGNSRQCRVTYVMPLGTLVAGGIMRFRQYYQLAVLGGTRLYENARGTLTVVRIKKRPRQERVNFKLVG